MNQKKWILPILSLGIIITLVINFQNCSTESFTVADSSQLAPQEFTIKEGTVQSERIILPLNKIAQPENENSVGMATASASATNPELTYPVDFELSILINNPKALELCAHLKNQNNVPISCTILNRNSQTNKGNQFYKDTLPREMSIQEISDFYLTDEVDKAVILKIFDFKKFKNIFATASNPSNSNSASPMAITNDLYSVEQEYLEKYLKLSTFKNKFSNLPKVKVGVIDTGVALHEDLPTIQKFDMRPPARINDTSCQNTPSTLDLPDSEHGTHVSGTIAAISNNQIGITGITDNAEIYAFMASNCNGIFENIAIANSILKGVELGVEVYNLSLGGPDGAYSKAPDQTVKEAIKAGLQKNAVFVVAAGNEHRFLKKDILGAKTSWEPHIYPAEFSRDFSGVITVAWANQDGTFLVDKNFNGSNGGEDTVKILAPGQDIISTVIPNHMKLSKSLSVYKFFGSNNQYVKWNGTSMATPHVTAAVSLMIGALKKNNISYNPEELEYLLTIAGSNKSQTSVLWGTMSNGTKITYNTKQLVRLGSVLNFEKLTFALSAWINNKDRKIPCKAPAGSYCKNLELPSSNSNIKKCPIGSFCIGQFFQPIKCINGFYSYFEGASTCLECEPPANLDTYYVYYDAPTNLKNQCVLSNDNNCKQGYKFNSKKSICERIENLTEGNCTTFSEDESLGLHICTCSSKDENYYKNADIFGINPYYGNICASAIHAGIISREGGKIKFELKEDSIDLKESLSNGIKSRSINSEKNNKMKLIFFNLKEQVPADLEISDCQIENGKNFCNTNFTVKISPLFKPQDIYIRSSVNSFKAFNFNSNIAKGTIKLGTNNEFIQLTDKSGNKIFEQSNIKGTCSPLTNASNKYCIFIFFKNYGKIKYDSLIKLIPKNLKFKMPFGYDKKGIYQDSFQFDALQTTKNKIPEVYNLNHFYVPVESNLAVCWRWRFNTVEKNMGDLIVNPDNTYLKSDIKINADSIIENCNKYNKPDKICNVLNTYENSFYVTSPVNGQCK